VTKTECQTELKLTENTEWINIPTELKNKITESTTKRIVHTLRDTHHTRNVSDNIIIVLKPN